MSTHQRLLYGIYISVFFFCTVSISAADGPRFIEYDGKTITSTPISGYKAKNSEKREAGGDAFLYGIGFDEKKDKPCYVELYWWRLTNDNQRQDFTTRFDICNGNPKGDKEIILEDAVAERLAVHSIEVCTNKKKSHRLKGAKIQGSFIDRNNSGGVTRAGSTEFDKFSRTNCSQWHAVQTCPAGKVAVGLNIEYNKDEFTGLGLRCASPQIMVASNTGSGKFAQMERSIEVQIDEDGRTETMTISQAISKHKVAGATVISIDNGVIDGIGHYRLRDFNDNLPTNQHTVYQVASLTKFIAALGMVKASRLSAGPKLGRRVDRTAAQDPGGLLDDWASKKFKGNESLYPEDITVRRLLSHTAGLSVHSVGTSSYGPYTGMRNILMGNVTAGRGGTEPIHPPGTKYDYSGGGFTVAEAMLEQQTGRSSRDFLNNEILKPYGMTRSTFDKASKDMANLARGCSKSPCLYDVWFTNVKFAGGLLAHPEDYARILTLVLNDGRDQNGHQVIPWEDLTQVMTPAYHKNSSLETCSLDRDCSGDEVCFSGECINPIKAGGDWYGLGVQLSSNSTYEDYPKVLSHGGSHPGFRTSFMIDRKLKNGFLIMINGDGEWNKGGVKYGGEALVKDIQTAFYKAY